MVTVIDYSLKVNKEGKEFLTLELQGDITMVQSDSTGKFYATAKKCSVTSTFDEVTAESLIGKQIPGNIVKVDCEEYEITDKETGEVRTISFRYEYQPETAPAQMRVVHSSKAA